MPSALTTALAVFVAGAAMAFHFGYITIRPSTMRVHNFSAGPSRMPEAVMLQAQREFLSYQGSGMGFMEMSHRDPSGQVQVLMKAAEKNVRSLLSIPDNYHVLFMHGGAHGQFAAVPMNLLKSSGKEKRKAVYTITGFWSERAAGEADKYGNIVRIDGTTTTADGRKQLAPPSSWNIPKDAAYVHFCACETIHGMEYFEEPDLSDVGVPLVADFTSTLLSRPVDVSKYGIIYASGGKNLGPAGFTLVIIRKDLISATSAMAETPSILNYHMNAGTQPIPSIYNTPPTFQIYIHSMVLDEYVRRGGLEAIARNAQRRAALIYEQIDSSNGFYTNTVQTASRSRMTIPFRIQGGNDALEKAFQAEAATRNMLQLHGHPVLGGLRITIYNGVPDESVELLATFLHEFRLAHESKA